VGAEGPRDGRRLPGAPLSTTILLLSVDEAPLLERSLPAALAQEGAEVVVVDNASADATGELAERHGARVLRLAERRSYAAAINEAVWATEGDAVLLLNADCVLDPDFLAAALPRLGEDGVGSVAPKLLRDGFEEVDAAGMFVDRRRKNGLVGHGAPAAAFARPGEAFGADGAAALYRRETLEACALGRELLDEDMALWASDADLAWRARLLGWRCVYEPRAVARHVRTYSPSTRSSVAESHRALQFRNRLLMEVKNETARALARDLPHIAAYEVLALGHVLLRERHLLGAYRDFWRALPGARRRRALVQSRRVVDRPPFGIRPPT
jgi:GT2 family glycosyltransferase